MSQEDIGIILSRHLASNLTTPIFLVDPGGNLLFYNEAAESILGLRFAETGQMSAEEWSTIFSPTDINGVSLDPEELPLRITLAEQRPAHRQFWVIGLDHVKRHLETSALPLIGDQGNFLGAVAIFWEVED